MFGDLGLLPDEDAEEVIAIFGLEQFTSHMRVFGRWELDSGEIAIEEASLTLDDLARLDVTGIVTGYTADFYNSVVALNAKWAERAAEAMNPADAAAYEEQALELMAQLGLARLSVRYDDDSLFMKVLDIAAAEQGVDSQTIGFGLRAMVPIFLAELGNREFTPMVSSAVNAFLDDPQSFTVVAEPDEPIRFDAVDRIEDDPNALIDILNLEVTAND